MRNALLALFLIVPLLVPAGMIIRHATAKGQEWQIPVTGYDPRDILRGRYIRFRYDFDANPLHYCAGDCIICLKGTPESYDATVVQKDYAGTCTAWINDADHFLTQPQHFYIPEAIAGDADILMRQSDGDIRADVIIRQGRMTLKALRINGTDIRDYIREQTDE